MVVRELPGGPTTTTVAVLVVNALPLVGILAFGWDVAALVTLYCFEVGVATLWTLVRAAFAGNPTYHDFDVLFLGALAEKRIALPIPVVGGRVWLSNLLATGVAAVIFPPLLLVVLSTPLIVVGAETLSREALTTILLATAGLFVAEGVRTAVEYFGGGAYRDHHAGTVFVGAFVRMAGLLFGTLLVVMTVGAATSAGPDTTLGELDPAPVGGSLLALVVLGKLSVDLASLHRDRLVAFYREHINDFDEPPVTLPSAPPFEPVSTELAGDVARVDPDHRHRLLGWPSDASRHPYVWLPAGFTVFALPLFWLAGAWATFVVVLAATICFGSVLVAVDHWLRYGFVEYRVGDSAVVAFDRLFRTPLWRVDARDERTLRVERGRIDGLLGTETVVIGTGDRTYALPGLESAAPMLRAFDRPAERPDPA